MLDCAAYCAILGVGATKGLVDLDRLAAIPGADPGGRALLLALLAVLTFNLAGTALRGQSIGKMLCGIRVVRTGSAEPPGFVRGALLRNLVFAGFLLQAGLGALLWLVDSLTVLRRDRRTLHDLLAGTEVITRRARRTGGR